VSAAPTDIAYARTDRVLHVTYDNGKIFRLPAALLRTESPSAEVQGHGPSTKKIVSGKENVSIERMEPVGNYAVRLVFDDGHDSGLFTWTYLYDLGTKYEGEKHA
jgi:DUF971 family protein